MTRTDARKTDLSDAAVSIVLAAHAENVLLVRQSVEGAVARIGATGRQLDDIKLAVTEACSNVVKHAYRGEAGPMTVTVDFNDRRIELTIADAGKWRDSEPTSNGEQPGMGLHIMESVADEHEIRREASGTEVELIFNLPAAAANGGAGDE